jgi:hypothetical protein
MSKARRLSIMMTNAHKPSYRPPARLDLRSSPELRSLDGDARKERVTPLLVEVEACQHISRYRAEFATVERVVYAAAQWQNTECGHARSLGQRA